MAACGLVGRMTSREGMEMTGPGQSKTEIEAIAADWVIRLDDDPLLDAEQDSLDLWLAADPSHRTAFAAAQSTWRDLAALRTHPEIAASVGNDFRPTVFGRAEDGMVERRTASGGSFALRQRGQGGSMLRRTMRVAATAACLLLTIGAAALWEGDPATLLTADYRTSPDETRLIALKDGSEVLLGPSSALTLRYDQERRGFDLLSGIAYVTAAPIASDPGQRPFQVDADAGSATALGTQYMVEKLGDSVRVTVAEHDVEVALPSVSGERQRIVLHPGESVSYSHATGLEQVAPVSLGRATGWRDGRLVFDRVPLSDVVAVLNRYRRGRIVIADPELSTRTVSGSFNTGDLGYALQVITRELDADTATIPPFVTLIF